MLFDKEAINICFFKLGVFISISDTRNIIIIVTQDSSSVIYPSASSPQPFSRASPKKRGDWGRVRSYISLLTL